MQGNNQKKKCHKRFSENISNKLKHIYGTKKECI